VFILTRNPNFTVPEGSMREMGMRTKQISNNLIHQCWRSGWPWKQSKRTALFCLVVVT